ncbi:MAG: restriction endonuclease [Clostridia bacterium]|nr:restriction endonuclease [Clostridia bacterium]
MKTFVILLSLIVLCLLLWYGSYLFDSSKIVKRLNKEIETLKAQKENLISDAEAQKQTLYNEIQQLKNSAVYYRQAVYKSKQKYDDIEYMAQSIEENIRHNTEILRLSKAIMEKCLQNFMKSTGSNLKAIPYMAGIMADFETYSIEIIAQKMMWGESKERAKKVQAIREIRKDAQAIVERSKEAQYQLQYLFSLYPSLEEILDYEFNQLPAYELTALPDRDNSKNYLSKEEYQALSVTERNQLALDRYITSHNRSKWQIGRDYELYVGYTYSQLGYEIDYFGSYMGLEDLGRDLIAKKENEILIVQCKYWSSSKTIHEKHIAQLYGTMISYRIENELPEEINLKGVLITNTVLSDVALKFANYLQIETKENFPMGDYPRIKCNIGHGEDGKPVKIYHLPFDQQYDTAKIKDDGEFFALTVKEAEAAGFRRAFRWNGDNETQ